MTWKAFDETDSTSEEDDIPMELPSFDAPEQQGKHPRGSTGRVSCCARFAAELNPCQPHFLLIDRATGRTIDVPESFSPPGTVKSLGYKITTSLLVSGILVYGWWSKPDNFYLSLPEHWAILFSSLYLLCSLWNTLWASRTPQPDCRATWRMRITWTLAEVASHTQGMALVLVWYQFYTDIERGDINWDVDEYFRLVTNGGLVAILVWIDAMGINRIPFRWMHWWCYVFPLESLWIGWSALYSLVLKDVLGNFYNGEDNGALFEFLDWSEDWKEASIYSAVGLFGVGPVVFCCLWWVSIYLLPCFTCSWRDQRKYLDSFLDHPDPRPTVNDIEEGSVFSVTRWRSSW